MIDKKDAERSGTERAAILLLTLGEQEAAQVLKHMGAKEVQRIGAAMAKLANVSREEVHGVITDFSTSVESQTSVGVGAEDFLRKVWRDKIVFRKLNLANPGRVPIGPNAVIADDQGSADLQRGQGGGQCCERSASELDAGQICDRAHRSQLRMREVEMRQRFAAWKARGYYTARPV